MKTQKLEELKGIRVKLTILTSLGGTSKIIGTFKGIENNFLILQFSSNKLKFISLSNKMMLEKV